MKKIILIAMLASLVGCATSGDLEELHAHVDADMKTLHEHIDADMKAMADSDAKSLSEINTKLDNMFKKSMTK
jgi:predicted small lipoprotein YifL